MLFKKGITLIELLVIIAIIGIFSGIGYVSFTSIDSGSVLRANKENLKSYIEEIKFKAFSDGKHYKVIMENSGNNINLKLYEPDTNNVRWRDLDLNRRCNCQSGDSSDDTCDNAFSNVAVSSLTSISDYDKTIERVALKDCDDENCNTEDDDNIELCFLYDGSSPRDKFFKLVGGEDLFVIFKLNKTGFLEE
jgi:prepilin-type N-terminal cleavage/methylation domain-containing protein